MKNPQGSSCELKPGPSNYQSNAINTETLNQWQRSGSKSAYYSEASPIAVRYTARLDRMGWIGCAGTHCLSGYSHYPPPQTLVQFVNNCAIWDKFAHVLHDGSRAINECIKLNLGQRDRSKLITREVCSLNSRPFLTQLEGSSNSQSPLSLQASLAGQTLTRETTSKHLPRTDRFSNQINTDLISVKALIPTSI